MEPIKISKFDILIINTLFPDLKKDLSTITQDIGWLIKKKLKTAHRKQLELMYEISDEELENEDYLVDIGLDILFDLDINNLIDSIRNRLDHELSSIILKENDSNQESYTLTSEGIQYYNRCWRRPQLEVILYHLKLEQFPFHPKYELNFPPHIVVVKNLKANNLHLLNLGLKDLKVSSIPFRSIIKNSIYLKGEVDQLGIIQNIQKIQIIPFGDLTSHNFVIEEKKEKSGLTYKYYLLNLESNQSFIINGEILEPEIPLQEDFWYYYQTSYERIRSGIQIKLYNPKFIGNTIQKFDQLSIITAPSIIIENTRLNLLETIVKFPNKDQLALKYQNAKNIIISWEDIENEVGLERKDIKKIILSSKKQGREFLFIEVEGKIQKQEYRLNSTGASELYLYLDDCYINPIDF